MTKSSPTHRTVLQGRRALVERTTTRRCPPARRRSGAGRLPTWLSAARVIVARPDGIDAGGRGEVERCAA
jgi:hypothetical protein